MWWVLCIFVWVWVPSGPSGYSGSLQWWCTCICTNSSAVQRRKVLREIVWKLLLQLLFLGGGGRRSRVPLPSSPSSASSSATCQGTGTSQKVKFFSSPAFPLLTQHPKVESLVEDPRTAQRESQQSACDRLVCDPIDTPSVDPYCRLASFPLSAPIQMLFQLLGVNPAPLHRKLLMAPRAPFP